MTLYPPAFSGTHSRPETWSEATTDWLASRRPFLQKPVSATPAGAAAVISRQEATLAQSSENSLYLLEKAASENALDEFVQTARQMNWDLHPAPDFLRAIALALQIEAHLTARDLAQHGVQRFPEQVELIHAAQILAPVKTLHVNLAPEPGVTLNQRWLQTQRQAFLGQWVALKNGELLAAGVSFQELRRQLGPLKNSGILVTRVY